LPLRAAALVIPGGVVADLTLDKKMVQGVLSKEL
jgi:hypothetical protein